MGGIQYIATDGVQNALDNLEMLEHFIGLDKPSKWKWAVIAAHQALYTFMLCALQGTSPSLNLASGRSRKVLRLHLEEEKTIPEIAAVLSVTPEEASVLLSRPYVISFGEALERIQAPQPHLGNNYQPVVLSETMRASIDTLWGHLRNGFEHFMPMGWTIQVQLVTKVLRDTVDIIRMVALDTGTILYMGEEQARVEEALERLTTLLKEPESSGT